MQIKIYVASVENMMADAGEGGQKCQVCFLPHYLAVTVSHSRSPGLDSSVSQDILERVERQIHYTRDMSVPI